jgi:hypothetical protein
MAGLRGAVPAEVIVSPLAAVSGRQPAGGIDDLVGVTLGAFVIAGFDGAGDIVYLETAASGQVTETPSVIAEITLTYDTLRSEALPRTASRELIMKVAEQKWT